MLYNPEWKQPVSKTAQNLLDAADLIRKHGLTKHIRYDGRGYCIHGAVAMVVHGGVYDGNAQIEMRSVVTYMNSMGIDPLAGDRTYYASSDEEQYNWIAAPWNNQPERTAEEVIAVLEGAAHAV